MRRFLTAAVAASALFAVSAPAMAQGINARQAQLEQRINQGVRGGGLTPGEAQQLRNEFRALQGLERQYRRSGGGISSSEQAELMTRFNILDARIYLSRIDRDYVRNWGGINARQAELDRRIDVGVRNGQLTRAEAARLRVEFKSIAMLENQYRVSGRYLSLAERRDLDRRLDALNRRIMDNRRDAQGVRHPSAMGINARQAELDRRIDIGVRNRRITVSEAARLRAEFKGIAQLENRYRSSGSSINAAEQRDLDRRLDDLNRRINAAAR